MKRDLIKFYAYLDNNDYLKEEHKTGQSMSNAIKNFIEALPRDEATSVRENEQAKEVCPNCSNEPTDDHYPYCSEICVSNYSI